MIILIYKFVTFKWKKIDSLENDLYRGISTRPQALIVRAGLVRLSWAVNWKNASIMMINRSKNVLNPISVERDDWEVGTAATLTPRTSTTTQIWERERERERSITKEKELVGDGVRLCKREREMISSACAWMFRYVSDLGQLLLKTDHRMCSYPREKNEFIFFVVSETSCQHRQKCCTYIRACLFVCLLEGEKDYFKRKKVISSSFRAIECKQLISLIAPNCVKFSVS